MIFNKSSCKDNLNFNIQNLKFLKYLKLLKLLKHLKNFLLFNFPL